MNVEREVKDRWDLSVNLLYHWDLGRLRYKCTHTTPKDLYENEKDYFPVFSNCGKGRRKKDGTDSSIKDLEVIGRTLVLSFPLF